MKSIIVLKPTINPLEKRFCKNCGADISHKRKGAMFCCHSCCDAYHEDYENKTKHVTWHDNVIQGHKVRTNRWLDNNFGDKA